MRYRPFGKTGLYVSELCFGCMTFGGRGRWQPIGEQTSNEATALVGTALDAGVNFIDTADVYSEGESERMLGEALKTLKRPRDSLVVATKVRGRSGPGLNDVGLSRGHIMSSIDQSLKRLQLDYVDLYQVHGYDAHTPMEETVRALDDVVRSGKARYVGYCNLAAWQSMKAIGIARAEHRAEFVSAQMYYSIADRDLERDVVPFCQDQNIAIMPWSPLAGGLLSGKFTADKLGPKESRRSQFDFPPVNMERLPRVLDALHAVAKEAGTSVARVALAWMLTKPFVTSIIIGARTNDQLVDNLAASSITLNKDHVARLDKASALTTEYPGWMLDWQNRDPRVPETFQKSGS